MALIKLTAVVDNISGKLNGSVFARNKGGHYIRSKSNPTNPQTEKQNLVRSLLSGVSTEWRQLTNGQREAWKGAAQDFPYQNKLGDSKIYSGFNLFVKHNQNLKNYDPDSPTLTSPMAPAPTIPPFAVTGSIGLNNLGTSISLAEVEMNFSERSPDTVFLIYATPVISHGVSNFKNRLRLIATDDGTSMSGNLLTSVITLQYSQNFGVPADGAKVGYGVRAINTVTGQGSEMITGWVEVYTASP